MKSAMGSLAAYRSAVSKWGGGAAIVRTQDECHVGTLHWTGFFRCKGSGKSWRAAHEDADRRARKKEGV